ncbi:MAG TPA: PRTRC system protein E [Niabella sp.]|nr:PRTRC system protein E [Niabella sp.]
MKTTNFFQSLAALNVEGDWQISIKAAGSNRMLVSVLFINDKVGDNARKLIPPMILKGSTLELDEGFFTAIENPVKQTASLLVNMEAYLKALEQAKIQSKMEQDKHQQQKKQKETDNKKYEAAMKKVADLEAAGKFREAYGQLPKAADYPEYEQAISEKKEELMAKFEDNRLFA